MVDKNEFNEEDFEDISYTEYDGAKYILWCVKEGFENLDEFHLTGAKINLEAFLFLVKEEHKRRGLKFELSDDLLEE